MLWSLSADVAESSPWHAHDIFEFVLSRDRGGWLLTDNGKIGLRPARTILIPPGTHHRFVFEANEIGRLKVVCIPPGELPGFLSPTHTAMLDGLCAGGASFADHPGQEKWLNELGDLIADGLGDDDVRTQQINWGAMGLLLALHAKESDVVNDRPGHRHKAKIREIIAWIDGNLEETPTIQQAASRFGLSRSLLTREFRHHTGKSFVDYRNARRVQKAALLLATRPDTITRVAFDSGFSNLSHFHRQFKAHFGLSPAAFRRKVLEEGGL